MPFESLVGLLCGLAMIALLVVWVWLEPARPSHASAARASAVRDDEWAEVCDFCGAEGPGSRAEEGCTVLARLDGWRIGTDLSQCRTCVEKDRRLRAEGV